MPYADPKKQKEVMRKISLKSERKRNAIFKKGLVPNTEKLFKWLKQNTGVIQPAYVFDPELINEELNKYLDYREEENKLPTLEGFTEWLGIDEDLIYKWRDMKPKDETKLLNSNIKIVNYLQEPEHKTNNKKIPLDQYIDANKYNKQPLTIKSDVYALMVSREMKRLLKKLKTAQRDKLLTDMLRARNPAGYIFLLKALHGYREADKADGQGANQGNQYNIKIVNYSNSKKGKDRVKTREAEFREKKD